MNNPLMQVIERDDAGIGIRCKFQRYLVGERD